VLSGVGVLVGGREYELTDAQADAVRHTRGTSGMLALVKVVDPTRVEDFGSTVSVTVKPPPPPPLPPPPPPPPKKKK
jgi:hypothetical protein